MRFYGIADDKLGEATELFPTREEAERFLADVLADEPGWESQLNATVGVLIAPTIATISVAPIAARS